MPHLVLFACSFCKYTLYSDLCHLPTNQRKESEEKHTDSWCGRRVPRGGMCYSAVAEKAVPALRCEYCVCTQSKATQYSHFWASASWPRVPPQLNFCYRAVHPR